MPAGLAAPVAIHDVAAQSGKKKNERNPEKLVSSLGDIVQAQKDGDSATAAIRQGEEICQGVRSQH